MTFEISLPILFVLFEWPSGFCFPCCLGCQLLFSGFHPLFLFCCVIALVVPGVHFLRARLQSSLLLELLLFLCIGIMGPSPASICLAELWLPRMFAIKLTNLDSFEILKLVCLYGQLEKECKTRMEAYFNWYVETSKNIIRYTLLLPLEKLTIISKDFQIGKILWGFWKLTLSPSGSSLLLRVLQNVYHRALLLAIHFSLNFCFMMVSLGSCRRKLCIQWPKKNVYHYYGNLENTFFFF